MSEQIVALEAERLALLRTSQEASIEKVRQLMHLKGSGINGAWLLAMEFFGGRALKNRREVGGLASLTPTPYQSGGVPLAGQREIVSSSFAPGVEWVNMFDGKALCGVRLLTQTIFAAALRPLTVVRQV